MARQDAALLAGNGNLPVSLAPGASTTLAIQPLDAGAATKSGWARLETDGGDLAGVATFQYVQGSTLRTIAGVFAAQPTATASIPVDNDYDLERLPALPSPIPTRKTSA